MFGRRFQKYKHYIAVGLLASLLPMLFVPFMKSSSYNGAEHHAEWLRGQLKGDVNESVDRAINSALLHDAHNLQLFLEAFVEAYLEESGTFQENRQVDKMLFEILHRHWQQLIGEGVVPYLSLKSLQARLSYARDRAAHAHFYLQKSEARVRVVLDWMELVSTAVSHSESPFLSLSVVPRGP